VSMLVIVPPHERQDPRAGHRQGGKALGGIHRPIVTGPEEGFGGACQVFCVTDFGLC
jgi:hypothetical protein